VQDRYDKFRKMGPIAEAAISEAAAEDRAR
jgi:hypothetical protein